MFTIFAAHFNQHTLIMANIRNLKKDIDFLVGEVISDCYTFMYLHGDKKKDEAVKLIEEIVTSRNELFQRANNPGKEIDKKQLKKHYKAIYDDLLSSVDQSFSKLSELTK